MRDKIHEIHFARAQHGWNCEVVFSLTTSNQCSQEWCDCQVSARTIIGAFLKALRSRARFSAENRAKPGEREAKGWT